jgi:hypothetical protein
MFPQNKRELNQQKKKKKKINQVSSIHFFLCF